MKSINLNHPYWKFHLSNLVIDKWEKRDQQLTHTFTIPSRDSHDEMEHEARIRVEEYLADKVGKIENFSIFTRYDENTFDLIVDIRMIAVKLIPHTA